ncbi:NADPH-dependent oxidoreductase [Sphingobacteriales bacterium UPWRP_1]|nr:NADPH-dependent oxidoreductase [Sphingobacteriales bacterium UPWRP_1]
MRKYAINLRRKQNCSLVVCYKTKIPEKMEKIKIVGIGGSLTENSNSLFALEYALRGAAELGAETTLFDIDKLNLPMYDTRINHVPPMAQAMCNAVAQAHGLIWCSPLYHGTISGAFKNALDWLELLSNHTPKYLTNKVVGLVSTAGGVQGLQAINTMEFVVRALRGWTVPVTVAIARAWQIFDEKGNLQDPAIEKQLYLLGKEVVLGSRRFAQVEV